MVCAFRISSQNLLLSFNFCKLVSYYQWFVPQIRYICTCLLGSIFIFLCCKVKACLLNDLTFPSNNCNSAGSDITTMEYKLGRDLLLHLLYVGFDGTKRSVSSCASCWESSWIGPNVVSGEADLRKSTAWPWWSSHGEGSQCVDVLLISILVYRLCKTSRKLFTWTRATLRYVSCVHKIDTRFTRPKH